MMGRRGFLKAIGVGVLGLSLALRNAERPILEAISQGLKWPTAMRRGDVFTITGIHPLNPKTYQPLRRAMHFVVTADCEAGDLVEHDVIYPRMITDGAYQNVNHEPDSNAAINLFPGLINVGMPVSS